MRIENEMIAKYLEMSGFKVERLEKYDAMKVCFSKKVIPSPAQVHRTLLDIGYEEYMFSINEACGQIFVRAVVG